MSHKQQENKKLPVETLQKKKKTSKQANKNAKASQRDTFENT